MAQSTGSPIVRTERVRTILERKGSDVWSLPPTATVYEAIAKMAEKEIGAVMVVSEDGQLVGVISERDYARKVILKHRLSQQTQVREIMTSPAVTVSPDHTVDQCMDIMTNHRIRHLPVVDGEKVIGVISIGDLVNNIIHTQAETIGHLHDYIHS